MKKLSLLIALCMLISIGGVYATWSYAQGKVETQTKYFDGDRTVITDKVVGTSKGTIAIDVSQLNIVIDDTNNDYYGEMSITGRITITFTPSAGASDDVTRNGIALQYQLCTTGALQYDSESIFTVDTEVHSLEKGKVWTIEAAELATMIRLNELYLPTAEDYDLFKAALHAGAIGITVSDPTATPQPTT